MIFPVLVIPLLFSVMDYLPEVFSFLSFNLGREFFAEIQLNSYLSLYLSIISIMVSAIIAYYLYKLEVQQKRKEKDQELEQNKEMVIP
jgi:membrane protein implicated in regulation of membrane protease activity